MSRYGLSEAEIKLICEQANRRAVLRYEFLKQRTNPFKHMAESGYVFDPAVQRFMSMKVTNLEHFQPTPKAAIIGLLGAVIPMIGYAYAMWVERTTKEDKIRKGEILYKDRLFKFQ